ILNSLKGFNPWLAAPTTGGGGRSVYELFINGLVSTDADGGIEPRLAARLPSLDDGSIKVLPDGRMQTTWNLRTDVKWHDGVPFTADDLVFSWQVNSDPDILLPGTVAQTQMESLEAIDS